MPFHQNFGYYVLLTELPTYLANILHFDIKSNSLYSAAPYLCCWGVALAAPLVTDLVVGRGILSKTAARKVANTVATTGPGGYKRSHEITTRIHTKKWQSLSHK